LTRDGLHHGLNTLLELLLVEAHGGDGKRGHFRDLPHGHSKVEALKLLSCSGDADQLLLQALLLGSQEEISRHQFRVQVLVHWDITRDVDSRRCKHLFRQSVHRAPSSHVHMLIGGKRTPGEASSRRSLRNAVSWAAGTGPISSCFQAEMLLTL
jgi:hypothetical protein